MRNQIRIAARLIVFLLLAQTLFGQTAPTSVAVSFTDTGTLIEWIDSSTTESYRVERQGEGGVYATVAQTPAGSRSANDTVALASGATYTYRVRAISGTNVSGPSAAASATYWRPGTGIGVGPIAERPQTCTPAVMYFAVDEGEWKLDQPGPDGQSYRCVFVNAPPEDPLNGTGDGTWLLDPYYKPHLAPHPMTVIPTQPQLPPTLISIIPNRAIRSQMAVPVLFTGDNFNTGGFAVEITECIGVTVVNITGVSNTERAAEMVLGDNAFGECNLVVRTNAGVTGTKTFTVARPTVISITPSFGSQGQLLNAGLIGTDLNGQNPDITILPNDGKVVLEDKMCINPDECTFDILIARDAPIGIRRIGFTSYDGTADNTAEFRVDQRAPPSLTGIIPGTCDRGTTCGTSFEGTELTDAALIKMCPDSVMSFKNMVHVNNSLITADVSVPLGPPGACAFVATMNAHPAIVGSAMVPGNSINIPPHEAGQLIVIYPYRNQNAGCVVPPGWNQTATPNTATGFWQGSYWRVAVSSNTESGIWLNCSYMGVVVLRNQGVEPIGQVTKSTNINQTTASYPANVFKITDGSSVAVAFGCTRADSATFAMSAPAGMTNLQFINGGPGSCGIHVATPGPNWNAQTVPVPTARYGTLVMEIEGKGIPSRLVVNP